MMRLLATILATLALGGAERRSPALPEIAVVTAPDQWMATYALAQPARRLVFARSPDTSRVGTWRAAAGFEIANGPNGEEVRRRDGAEFISVTVRMPPAYRDLPKDYAPFSPFGDGGFLVHTARFFACPGPCAGDGRWRMTLTAPLPARIVLDGAVHRGAARWRDGESGRNVYVGAQRLTVSGNLVAVVDTTLPPPVALQLDRDLPWFMRYFAARLGRLRQPPMLFVSYDASYRDGWGRQGGTLPGQVFVHFYGAGWRARMAAPDFGFDLAWHLAHESAHLYQRGLEDSGQGAAWIHEGAAEASAAIAVGALAPANAPEIAARIDAAGAACATATRRDALQTVIARGDFDAAYHCGLVLNMALHRAVLAARPASDGLFAVWRAYLAGQRRRPALTYRAAAAQVAGRCVADALAASATLPGGATGTRLADCGPPPSRATAKPMAPDKRV